MDQVPPPPQYCHISQNKPQNRPIDERKHNPPKMTGKTQKHQTSANNAFFHSTTSTTQNTQPPEFLNGL